MVSVAGSTSSSLVRARRGAPDGVEVASRAWDDCSAGVPCSGLLRPWTRAGSHRFPGDPSHAFALLQDPGRADRTSPLAVLSMLPPVPTNRRPQRVHDLEADTGLQHPLSTLHERRRRHPCKTRFRLAGCAFAGRELNPLDRFERFQVISSSPFPGLRLSQRTAGFPQYGWKAGFPNGAFPDRQQLKLAPSMRRPTSSLHRPSCTSSSQR